MTKGRLIYLMTAYYLVFLLSILFVFGYTPTNDTEGYVELAELCIEQGQPYPCLANINNDSFIWNIGSVNLIILSLLLFKSIMPLLILMCLMKAGIALLTAKIAQTLFDDKVALIALLIFVLYPNNWGESTTLMSEIPTVFLALLSIYLVLQKKKLYVYVIAGALLCLSNWFRSLAPIFIVSILAYFILFRRKIILRRLVPYFFGYFLLMIIIGTESYIRTDHFIYKGDTMWFTMCDDAYNGAQIAPHWNEEQYIEGRPRYIENMEELNCFERRDIWKDRCLAWIMDHKVEYLMKTPWKIYYMYFNDLDFMPFMLKDKSDSANNYVTIPYRNLKEEFSNLSFIQYVALTSTVFYYIILLLFVAGTIRLACQSEWKRLALPLMIVAIGTIAITLVIHGETRFKVPFMPFIIMIGASLFTSSQKELLHSSQ